MAAQWCVDRLVGRWRWVSSMPCRPPVPAVLPSRRTRSKGTVGCLSVPRELAADRTASTEAEAEAETEEEGVECEGCNGAGWLLCDFCKGKKNNVKSEGSRIYRRCPTCKAAGFIICPRCRVYKCITYPENNES
ncbi:hypothetical protein GUJ93_ZPchr0008g12875 [Zizania palustris]|uniref:Uncharacterized protein n=1 Tax=Zizania palustris TaxID=103762 RepID=A0A8J5RZL3_ZIZPA|nr:hypothetical protein GUJ93_ZPchr0008g12875 [Zizania palustris]